MATTPGYLNGFPAAYKDNEQARLEAYFGLDSLIITDALPDEQWYTFKLLNGDDTTSLPNPWVDANWTDFHVDVIAAYLASKRYVDALNYMTRLLEGYWRAAIDAQITSEFGPGE